ncbi:LytTR family transcriptional regulator [Alkalibaculum sp. M08DMB]|uniref:LytTR family transcriptional regulator n=1 Tax=Alkalibaculum sporogenes TaxID=2655001 RepID=A0A6A7K851_9FIRM|nr:LytTR family DNA-binding domain-containing protein [Alkalibaculum sporogenes]MPW25501.1 LytTR family transcriptional regulator [Alkalibaculum sporogenes]
MKIRIEYIKDGEDEIVFRCHEISDEILEVMSLLNLRKRKISGQKDGKIHLIEPSRIYYFESVDNVVFAYTEDSVYKVSNTLSELETLFYDFGFFRCSKSMVINLNEITSLKSEMGNRIDTTMKNGEHIIISRHYAKQFREVLQT